MSTLLQDRVFLVTGGAGAIGTAISKVLLERQAKVVLLDVDGKSLGELAQSLHTSNCLAHACDVTQRADADAAVAYTVEKFGRVDGLVNNAGIITMNAAWDADAAQWQRHFEVNATGAFVMAQAVGEYLKQNDGGVIVNVASNCGKVGYPNMAAYNASKAALINLTRSLAVEWASDHINVNAVCPGGVDTAMLADVAAWLSPRLHVPADNLLGDMGPAQLGRRIAPEEVGRVVAFLLSDDAVIIRGQAINVDGGDTPY